MKSFFTLTCLLVGLVASSQVKYPVSAIPAALMKDAHVVKRMEDIRYEIRNLHSVRYIRSYAYTILNEAGQQYADLVVGYDKLHTINNIEGALFDAAGNQVKKVKGKEIKDFSNVSDNSLYEDSRVKVHDFNYKSFPYTVVYEVDMDYTNTFSIPTWRPQQFENMAVEQSAYTIVSPEDYQLRHKAFNYKEQPVTKSEKGIKGHRWEVKNLVATSRPFASPLWNELTPTVYFGPSDFEIEGYKGNAGTWADFGKFQLKLNEGRDKLPASIQQKVVELTQGLSTPEEKIKRLYEYMQQNTRYISVQLGIGGLQPFEASYVAQKGYGDCKALSNYMYSLLKAVGIKSYYSWIRGGHSLDDRFVMEDFPFDVFNHIVLCVPLAKDTMWLECTSQTDPAGYMGSFTGNRKALVITEDGGKLLPTPRYDVAENVQVRKINGSIDEGGNLSLQVASKYKGVQQDYYSSMVNNLTKEQVKKSLNERLDFSTYDINKFAYNIRKASLPEVDEELQINVSNYATVSGKRLFVLPNVMSRDGKRIAVDTARTVDYVFDNPYTDIDTIEISLPAGYAVEVMLPEAAVKTKYGNYTSKAKVEGSKLTYYRKIEIFSGRFAAKEGAAISEFYGFVYKADRSRIVLVKKEGESTNKSAQP
ncbi:MAG: DUF3857 domain-containing protein [Chitinophagaceae bacterium]|nr:MAG: DUF3857 domain-containing protein [Chitinophagaceae bacterium]